MITTLWSGLGLGAIYAIVGLTYAITLNATGTFNFAQAQLVTVGVFGAYVFGTTSGIPVWITVALCTVLCAAAAVLEELTVIRLIRGVEGHVSLIVTLGVAVVIDGVALAIWGSNPFPVRFPGGDAATSVLGGRVSGSQLVLIVAAIVIAAGLWTIERRTRIGLAMRATAADVLVAALRGVRVRRVGTAAFAVAGAIVGLLAVPIGSNTFAVFNVGDILVTFSFVALTLGGFRNYWAILAGGLAVGVLGAIGGRYFDPSWANVIVFIVFLIALQVRPAGLAALSQRREI